MRNEQKLEIVKTEYSKIIQDIKIKCNEIDISINNRKLNGRGNYDTLLIELKELKTKLKNYDKKIDKMKRRA